jgi:glucokinase
VCRLVDELDEAGVITQVGAENVGKAKRKTALLDINAGGGWVVALEAGGSHIRASAMDLAGHVWETVDSSMDNVMGEALVTEAITEVLERILAKCRPSRGMPLAVGVSSSGIVDPQLGVVKLSFNLQLNSFPMRQVVKQVCDVPVVVSDDISASTLAEAKFGAGRRIGDFAFVTVGMGIGCGYFIGHKVFPLSEDSQFGLMVVAPEGDPDRFGGRGYLESLASGRGIAATARRELEAGTPSLLNELTPRGPAFVTAKNVADAAHMGDELAGAILAKAANYLAIGITSLAHALGLNFFVLNGGVSGAGDVFWEPLKESVRKYEFWPGRIHIEPSVLGGDAAVIGAGALALDRVFDPAQ